MQGKSLPELRHISPSEPNVFSQSHDTVVQAVKHEMRNRKTLEGVRLINAKIV